MSQYHKTTRELNELLHATQMTYRDDMTPQELQDLLRELYRLDVFAYSSRCNENVSVNLFVAVLVDRLKA